MRARPNKDHLLVVGVAAVFILLWQFAAPVFVPSFLLPTPWEIVRQYSRPIDWPGHTLVTLSEALIGFAIGTMAGIILAILITESGLLRKILMPYIVLTELTPKVAVAPIIYVLLGFTDWSRILLVALILFFPIVINTSAGLLDVDKNLVYLLKSLGGKEATIFFKVRLPNSLPHLFDGIRISIVVSMIGAIIAEFVSSSKGLGFLIINSQYTFEIRLAFASLLILTMIGLGLYGLVELTARLTMPWFRR